MTPAGRHTFSHSTKGHCPSGHVAFTAFSHCEASLHLHSWKWSWSCLWTHVGYVAHSTQMAFYIYCLAYLVIFSHMYVCFQQADNMIFENRKINILCSFSALHLLAVEKQAKLQKETCQEAPSHLLRPTCIPGGWGAKVSCLIVIRSKFAFLANLSERFVMGCTYKCPRLGIWLQDEAVPRKTHTRLFLPIASSLQK
jgi:hypothetical protein